MARELVVRLRAVIRRASRFNSEGGHRSAISLNIWSLQVNTPNAPRCS